MARRSRLKAVGKRPQRLKKAVGAAKNNPLHDGKPELTSARAYSMERRRSTARSSTDPKESAVSDPSLRDDRERQKCEQPKRRGEAAAQLPRHPFQVRV